MRRTLLCPKCGADTKLEGFGRDTSSMTCGCCGQNSKTTQFVWSKDKDEMVAVMLPRDCVEHCRDFSAADCSEEIEKACRRALRPEFPCQADLLDMFQEKGTEEQRKCIFDFCVWAREQLEGE